ncbi:Protein of unknown function [Fulvimarina manganoxydans]|uniref:DUF669 domain-containing protein n=1 Tax=Fulvimarina manganoxydans TaxID=937218 RepID=A0A1W1YZ91_9HYPH|nr:DUF669 domain-containing protein [Fulvimarina manganoxydans]SMC41443.1 Protein of unknown function [Fulvimarina manganoxydans]
MVDISGFNANDYEPTQEYEVLPEGKYHAEIVNSEERDIGQGGSKGLKLTLQWKILSGSAEGRIVFQDILHRYNVQGEKGDKTREIAARQLSSICHAVGRLAPNNTDELHNIPCEISVGFQKQNVNPETGEKYALRNEIKGVKPWSQNGNAAPRQQSSPPPQARQSTPPAAGGWARRAG